MENDPNDEFVRKQDDNSFGSDTNNDFDEAFLEYGTDEEENARSEVKKEEQIDGGNNLVNSKQNEVDESYRQELEDGFDDNDHDHDATNEVRCAYCGIVNPAHLVKCTEKDCQRWFCNGRTDDYSASHIVFHLTKSKHKEVFMSEQSQVGEMMLECYNCLSKNIFLLGFLESIEGDSGFILCREPCLTICKMEEDKFDKSKWKTLINDKKLMEWIVPMPSESDLRLCHRVNIRTMSKMEEKWEKDKLKVSEEKPKFLGNFLKPVKLCYNDGQDYLETFEPLISAEEEYDRKLKESQRKTNIKTTFYRANRRSVARFVYPKDDTGIILL